MTNTSIWSSYGGKEISNFSLPLPYSHLDPIDVQNSPKYYSQALWIVSWLCILEYVILWIQEKPLPFPHENLLSMAHACFNHVFVILTRSLQYQAYIWIWKLSPFPNCFSDSPWSFLGSIVLIDFGYYWFHKASHELMVLWSIHQVHHSSEDITASVGLRHSPLQNLFSWVFYLPFAFLGLPPSHFVFHIQFNLFYQTWIHTTAVNNLGILENVFNTPSHHRVHHGSTKYCIDKNYGGVFIFWDFLFGTFQKEKDDTDITYGIIVQPEFFNVIQHQIFYMQYTIDKARSMGDWKNFLKTFVWGPSWLPGYSRLGSERDGSGVIGTRPRVKANNSFPIDCYVFLHLLAAFMHCTHLAEIMGDDGLSFVCAYAFFIVISLTNFGFLYEGKAVAAKIELCRSIVGTFICFKFLSASALYSLFLVPLYLISVFLWLRPSKIHAEKFGLRNRNENLELKQD